MVRERQGDPIDETAETPASANVFAVAGLDEFEDDRPARLADALNLSLIHI